VTDGTENHLILWDLRPNKLTGSKMQEIGDAVGITFNKNAVHGDRSAMSPGGVRIGSPALTTRGLNVADFEQVGDLLHECAQLALTIQSGMPDNKLATFQALLKEGEHVPALEALRLKVNTLATTFPMPGFDCKTMKFNTIEA